VPDRSASGTMEMVSLASIEKLQPNSSPHHCQTGSERPMNSISTENRKTLMLFSGRAYPGLADEIGAVLGVAPTPTEIYEFASGEVCVRYKESVRGSDAFVIQSMSTPVNTWLMETLIMIDALK